MKVEAKVNGQGPHSRNFLGKSEDDHRKISIEQSINLELGNNDAIIIVINFFIFTSCLKLLYMTLLLNRELVSRAKLCLDSVFPDIVNDCPNS